MGVWDLEADHGHAHAFAGDGALELEGDIAGKEVDVAQQVVRQVEVAVDFQFRNDQCVSFGEGLDVEEGQEAVVLGNLVAGNFAGHDAAEDAGHGGRVPAVSRVRS